VRGLKSKKKIIMMMFLQCFIYVIKFDYITGFFRFALPLMKKGFAKCADMENL
jgi:hypothetical protein